MKKQLELKQKIQEMKDKLQFEEEQRQKIIKAKKESIARKENSIKEMITANNDLENQLKTLEKSIDEIKLKEKNEKDKKENKEKINKTPLEHLLEVKKEELSGFIKANNKYSKKINELKNELEQKINIDNINN